MIAESLSLLGKKVKDRVTGYTGVVTSVSFDLYGCVQALVTPSATDGKEPYQSFWFDVKRLTEDGGRVMDAPVFDGPLGTEPGGNALPQQRRTPVP